MSGNLKRKALKVFETDDLSRRVFKSWEESGMSQQDYFTIGVLKALTFEYDSVPRCKETNSIQIRLDDTLHKLLKEKSMELNISMEKMILTALDNEVVEI